MGWWWPWLSRLEPWIFTSSREKGRRKREEVIVGNAEMRGKDQPAYMHSAFVKMTSTSRLKWNFDWLNEGLCDLGFVRAKKETFSKLNYVSNENPKWEFFEARRGNSTVKEMTTISQIMRDVVIWGFCISGPYHPFQFPVGMTMEYITFFSLFNCIQFVEFRYSRAQTQTMTRVTCPTCEKPKPLEIIAPLLNEHLAKFNKFYLTPAVRRGISHLGDLVSSLTIPLPCSC